MGRLSLRDRPKEGVARSGGQTGVERRARGSFKPTFDSGCLKDIPDKASMTRRIPLSLLHIPAHVGAQEPTSGVFTWSGRLAAGATLRIRHFNGPTDVREASGDRVEFSAERRSRRSNELSFEV